MTIGISVVVPVKNEEENVAPLANEIAAAVANETAVEIIFVDDGSTDGTTDMLLTLRHRLPQLRIIRHARNLGQSRSLRTGVRAAKFDTIVTLDGDGQNDPADIPKLLAILGTGENGIGIVSGIRTRRRDNLSRRLVSRAGNAIRSRLLRDGASDTGCGLKVFRRDAFLMLPYFDHMHRFIIALMLREGFDVRFISVNHRERRYGTSKYTNFGRMLVSVHDLLGVRWLQRRYRSQTEAREL